MINHKNRAWAEIDLDALGYNFKNIKAQLKPETKTMCVVKADAYGHGSTNIAAHLLKLGADCLAVATPEEALSLRKNKISADILILGYVEKECFAELISNNITLTVFDMLSAEAVSEAAQKQNKTAKIHIKIDTGMTRIGYCVSEKSADEIIKISKLKNIYLEGMFSHFSKADETDKTYSRMQFERFMEMDRLLFERGLRVPVRHIANSAAIIDLPEYQLDMVRPGVILYGIYPSNDVKKENCPLKAVMSVKARITRIREIESPVMVSYGGTYEARSGEKIATVPVGYADGYSRVLTGSAKMLAGGKIVPVVGKICMDQCMIDVTSVNNINVGDEVIILGKEGDNVISAENLADIMGTIGYEILCMVGKRLTRIYTQGGKIVNVLNYLENW